MWEKTSWPFLERSRSVPAVARSRSGPRKVYFAATPVFSWPFAKGPLLARGSLCEVLSLQHYDAEQNVWCTLGWAGEPLNWWLILVNYSSTIIIVLIGQLQWEYRVVRQYYETGFYQQVVFYMEKHVKVHLMMEWKINVKYLFVLLIVFLFC